jgi:hypothetical protein
MEAIMSKLERAAWLSLIVEIVVAVYYFSAIFAMGPDVDIQSPAMAGLVGRVIMLAIILGIVSEIIMNGIIRRNRDTVPEDERDALISAKSYRNGFFALAICCAGIIGQIVLSEGARTWWMKDIVTITPVYAAHLLLLAMMLSSFTINASRIFFYRRGY